jgi:dolichol kinase
MAVLFTIVNFVGVETGMLKGMHDTKRKSFRTVFYPMTFFILVAACWNGHKAVFILSMMVLAFSDAAAATVGELMRRPHEYHLGANKKSLEGSSSQAVGELNSRPRNILPI